MELLELGVSELLELQIQRWSCWSCYFRAAGVGLSELLELGFQSCLSEGLRAAQARVSELLELGTQSCRS